jgi:hypothetical protein
MVLQNGTTSNPNPDKCRTTKNAERPQGRVNEAKTVVGQPTAQE